MALAALTLPLTLSGCGDDGATTAGTGDEAAAVDDGRLTGTAIYDDPERFETIADQMRQEFTALSDSPGPEPVVLGLHVCSVLHEDNDEGRDVQERHTDLIEGFSGDGYLSADTGQHWVDLSIERLCPELEPELAS